MTRCCPSTSKKIYPISRWGMETGLCHSPVIETQMETLAGMLENYKGKKVYGYLRKPVKAQADAHRG